MTTYHLSATPKTKKQVQEAQLQIESNVSKWVQTYADTITKNYRDYHIKTLKGNLSGNIQSMRGSNLTRSKTEQQI